MEREMEFLRQQIEYLNRMLETCMVRINSLEIQVAELERRPVALLPPEEPEEKARERFPPTVEGRVGRLLFGEATFQETRGRRKG